MEGISWVEDFLRPLDSGDRPKIHTEFFAEKIEVRNIAKCGRGLFLSSDAVPGEVLFVEQACFEGEGGEDLFLEAACFESWQDLGESTRRRWRLLGSKEEAPEKIERPTPVSEWGNSFKTSSTSTPSSSWLSSSVRLNGMANVAMVSNPNGVRHVGHEAGEEGGLSLYAVGGLLNHSCCPSVEKVAFPGWLVVRARRNLRKEAELTQSYIDACAPPSVRRRLLRESWGFTCNCDRCQLEEVVWSDPKLVAEGDLLWQAYHALMVQKRGGLRAMSQLVEGMYRITAQALGKCLVDDTLSGDALGSIGMLAQFKDAFKLTPNQSRSVVNHQDPDSSADPDAVRALQRLRNYLLASYWVSPAMQFAHGLNAAGRFEQCLELLTKIEEVFQEVLPSSSMHVATSVQLAVCAADAGRPEPEVLQLLARAAKVVDAAYGDGCKALELLLSDILGKGDTRGTSMLLGQMVKRLQEKGLAEAAAEAECELAAKAASNLQINKACSASSSSPAEAVPGCATTKRTLKHGSGKMVGRGSTVKVHATGIIVETQKLFWTTKGCLAGQEPFRYRAGVGEVIPGWDHGCLGMQVGEERQLIIPAQEGYGRKGFPDWQIPPDATLQFNLECLSIENGVDPTRPDNVKEDSSGPDEVDLDCMD
eukprot:TRINITY_DN25451_c0_g1_i1.p1 TRINITY_DN25451_c0_g1~~TRINITY_DN25451_c0_g1_i1.p1  ORF type:complete len:674 (-),score=139.03 TRINITY_DN25451_c0_g1_i1:9-1952(-)